MSWVQLRADDLPAERAEAAADLLLERAGLSKSDQVQLSGSGRSRRYDVMNDGAGQIKDPNRPS